MRREIIGVRSKNVSISLISTPVWCYLQSPQQEDWDSSTVCSALKHFERLVETTRMTLLEPGCRETLTSALETVVERTQDFTDSAYTSHEHRENILLLCDRAKLELNTLLRIGNSMVSQILNIYFIFKKMHCSIRTHRKRDLQEQCRTRKWALTFLSLIARTFAKLQCNFENYTTYRSISEENSFAPSSLSTIG